MRDIYDGEPWSDASVEDLKQHMSAGATLEETAGFLYAAIPRLSDASLKDVTHAELAAGDPARGGAGEGRRRIISR